MSSERSGPSSPPAAGGSGPPAWPGSEVLLPPLLSLNGIQDGLPLGLVLLPDLFNFLLHHGVEGQEPLPQVLHCPTLKLEEKWKVQSPGGKGERRTCDHTEEGWQGSKSDSSLKWRHATTLL